MLSASVAVPLIQSYVKIHTVGNTVLPAYVVRIASQLCD